MPKKNSTNANKVILDVLDRIKAVVEKRTGKRVVGELEGGHSFDLNIRSKGEVAVGKGSQAGDDVEVCTIGRDAILLAAVNVACKDSGATLESLAGKALTQANRDALGSGDLKVRLAEFDAAVLKHAKQRDARSGEAKFVTRKPSSNAQRGKASGFPEVVITGQIAGHDLTIEVGD